MFGGRGGSQAAAAIAHAASEEAFAECQPRGDRPFGDPERSHRARRRASICETSCAPAAEFRHHDRRAEERKNDGQASRKARRCNRELRGKTAGVICPLTSRAQGLALAIIAPYILQDAIARLDPDGMK